MSTARDDMNELADRLEAETPTLEAKRIRQALERYLPTNGPEDIRALAVLRGAAEAHARSLEEAQTSP